MSENITSGDTSMPPKLNLKKTDQPPAVINIQSTGNVNDEASKHTTRIELPDAPPEATATLKKKTSRIPLDQVSAESGAATGSPAHGIGATKTIRLTSAAATPTITITPSQKVLSGSMILDDAKRQTSRIPLELATSDKNDVSTGQSNAPKTIRIKRPTVTQSIVTTEAPRAAPLASETPQSPMSTTSHINLPESEEAASGQATQRRTIKIRRPEGGGAERQSPRSPAVARVEREAAAHAASETAGDVSASHPIFPALAAVAVVLLCVLVYVLITQAFPNLGWSFPGKVVL